MKQTIFMLFVRQLEGLDESTGRGWVTQTRYLLESLATVKTAVLLADLGDRASALISRLFNMLITLSP
jgi:hypothetical protein